MKKTVAIIFTYLLCLNSQANNIDSLKHLVSIQAKEKPELLLQISDFYSPQNLDSALLYAEEATIAADSLNRKETEAKANTAMAIIYFKKKKYNKAVNYHTKALNIYIDTKNKFKEACSYNNIGEIFATKIINHQKAELNFNKAQTILENSNSANELGKLYFNQGLLMVSQNKNESAINFFQKCIDTKCNNINLLYKCYSLLAELNISKNNYIDAAKYLTLANIYKDSVHIQQNNKQLLKYKTQLLNQKHQNKIEQLKQTTQLQHQELKKRRNLILLISILALAFLFMLIVILYLYKKIVQKNKTLKLHKKQITKQKEELETNNATLIQSKIMAEKHNAFKSDFLANVGHELRTPLNAIIGYAKLMYNSISEKSNIKYLDNISQASDNLLIIINDLLDFSKIEAGKMIVDKTPFNPVNIVTRTISTLRIHAEEKSNTLEIHIDPNLPDYVIGDQNHLSQILTHIIRNAIKFSPINKPISIEVHCSQEGTNCMITFIVTDHGVGIDESKQEAIFESFNQIRSSDKKKYSGTGLGLSIVKRLVSLQEGTISLNSKPDKGTTFTINIPYKITNNPIKYDIPKDNDHKQQKEVNILLVEDNEINQELAIDTIQSWGSIFKIDVAENGLEAIKLLEKKDYDIILMDIQMPEMDGHEATIHIRTKMDEKKSKTPILGMTAHALQSERDLALKNGMDDYVTKPINPTKLKQIISSYVFK